MSLPQHPLLKRRQRVFFPLYHMSFYLFIKHAPLPWVILQAMFTLYTILLKEKQWLWTSTTPLQLQLSLIHISAVYDQLHAHYNFIVVQSQSVQ
jgi:hypothetical protein